MGEGLFSYDILDAELAKIKNQLMDEIKALKNESIAMHKTIDEQKREISELKSKQFSQRKIDSMIDDKIQELKNNFVREGEFGPILNKNKDFRFVLDHIKELDKLSITKKQFNKFDVNVNHLRREAAYLTKLAKEMEKLSNVEKSLMNISRKNDKLSKRFDAYEVRKWK